MKTIVEAGHYYSVNGPSVLSMKGWEIGKDLVANESDAELALFIDDYHHEQTFLERGDTVLGENEGQQAAEGLSIEADHIFSESALAESAPQKMSELLENGLVKLKKGVLTAGGVRLGCLRRQGNRNPYPDVRILGFSPTIRKG